MKEWYAIYSNILYMYFSGGFYDLPESAKNAISPTSPFKRLLKVAGYTVVRLIGNLFQPDENPEKLKGKVWLYVVSQNNYDSLKFVADHVTDAVFVAGQSKEIGQYNHQVARLSLRKKLFFYYWFLPLLLYFIKQNRAITIRFFDILFDAIGFYEVYLSKIRKYKPACIIFANDHTADARAMLMAAKTMGIKTVYIQHASVSRIFPPLQYDLNLLEGQDSLEKYKACGAISGVVELIGMPKADAYFHYRNTNNQIKTIGIGANLMDLTTEIRQVVTQLAAAFPELQIILRPHPRDKRDFSFIHEFGAQVRLSDGRQVPTFDFLRQIDVLVAGNSGIHLEAVLLNVWSVYYNFNPTENLQDYYGYVANGLSDHALSKEHLLEMIQKYKNQKPEVFKCASYYNATVGTTWDGRSAELAISHIKSLLQYK